ncbi:MAG TPA: DUF4349 domain-containing protein [Micromonosporaceae bacterium]|nr:DUF4349 domain-containing protein [Micromonosporaceae bacterium]
MPYPRSRRASAVLGLLAAIVVIAGCGADDSGGATATRDEAPAVAPQDAAPAAGAVAKEDAKREPAKPGENPVPVGAATRSVVYTGTITVQVDNRDDAAAEAAALVTGVNGFLATDQRQNNGSGQEARLVLRVPAEHFWSMLDKLAGLGRDPVRSVETQDVTEQVVDLEVRVANSKASVDRIRALMARAQTIGEIVSLESELSRREADLESLQARMRKIQDLTALSTITAILQGHDDAEKPAEAGGFAAGFTGGWRAFVGSLRVLLTVFGALLPWMIALGVPIAAVLWLLRRSRRRRQATAPIRQPTPAATPVADPPG